MQDENIDFSKFTDTSDESYKKKMTRSALFSAVNSYVICPLTLLALLLGILFNTEDALRSVISGIKEANRQSIGEIIAGTQQKEQEQAVTEETETERPIYTGFYVTDKDGNINRVLSDCYIENKDNEGQLAVAFSGKDSVICLDLTTKTVYASNASKYEIDIREYDGFEGGELEGKGYSALVVQTFGSQVFSGGEDTASVGEAFASELELCGIKALHCSLYFDEKKEDAYRFAAKEIQNILKEHPTVKYVFDIQTDEVMLSSGQGVKCLTEVFGSSAAQAMFVVGTDSLGESFDGWEDNLSFAATLYFRLNGRYKNFMRPVSIKQSAYNQQYSDIAMTVLIGTCENTFEEAELSAKLIAREVSQVIKGE